jgi:hypothetical protein
MEWCRSRGIRCVLNQMDPSRAEIALVREDPAVGRVCVHFPRLVYDWRGAR